MVTEKLAYSLHDENDHMPHQVHVCWEAPTVTRMGLRDDIRQWCIDNFGIESGGGERKTGPEVAWGMLGTSFFFVRSESAFAVMMRWA